MISSKPKIIIVAGPTAVGKSSFAIDMAKENNGEIVSLDSVQVYKYLDIGSAKLKKEEMQGIIHHMIDVVEPDVNLNVKEYKDMAVKCISDILERKKTPILVGGTGFYIRAILYGTEFLYEDKNEVMLIRNRLYEEKEKYGIKYLYDRLEKIDKKSHEMIPIGNERRVIRALEFYDMHGIPISLHNEKEREKESIYDYDFYVLNSDRNMLYNNINKRVEKMIEDGLVDEVKKLVNMGLSKDCNSMKSIGYSELYDYCKKNVDDEKELEKIIELIKQHTRNYAKRQLTWFRAQKNIKWIEKSQ